MLGSTAVIRNEPTCAAVGCHAHEQSQSVLGVLDIVYPLDKIDQTIRRNTATIAGLSLGFIVLAAILVSVLVQRVVYRQLADLSDGEARLASGDLDHPIPVRSDDELGERAEAFFVVRAREPGRTLLVLSASTWAAGGWGWPGSRNWEAASGAGSNPTPATCCR